MREMEEKAVGDTDLFGLVMTLVAISILVTISIIVITTTKRNTVEKDTTGKCVRAYDFDGNRVECSEVMEGLYDTVWVAPSAMR